MANFISREYTMFSSTLCPVAGVASAGGEEEEEEEIEEEEREEGTSSE